MKFIRILPEMLHRRTCPFSSSTLNIALGRVSITFPSCSIATCLDIDAYDLNISSTFYIFKGRQLLGPALPDNNRKFEMRRFPVVGGMDGPAIPGQVHTPSSRIHHRLDTDDQSFREARAVPLTPVVRDAGILVHAPADAVTFQFTDD